MGIDLRFQAHHPRAYTRTMWDYSRADLPSLKEKLSSIDWDEVCNGYEDVDFAVTQWTKIILETAKLYIPNKDVTVRPRDKPWYNNRLRREKRKLDRCHKKAKRRNMDQDWALFRGTRNTYIQHCRDAENQYDNDRINRISTSSFSTKECWSLYRSVLGLNKDSSCPSLIHDNQVYSDSKLKADLLNSIFAEKSRVDDTDMILPDTDNIRPDNILDHIEISLTEVQDQLSILDVNKSYGPDGISPKLLRNLKDVIAPSLCKLFNATLWHCKVPCIWKQANVTPIHKKGDKSDPNNYRPVSLLSIPGKVLEKIIFKHIFNHIRDNSILTEWQSGFMPGCSTVSQLLEIYHKFCQSVESGKEVRVIFLDISRAFDRVWHAGLLYKLKLIGIDGSLLAWITDYLKDREQRVCLDGVFSEWCRILAGVPQGSILGPLLFLIFINDLTEVIQFTKIRLFADDTCLFIEVDNRATASELLNTDLQSIHEWSNQWLVSFNESKTKSLIISNKRDRALNPPLVMNDVILDEVQSHKHLGITLSHNLTWTKHIDEICIKARKRLDIIQRFKFKLNRRDLQRFYVSFVLPLLEYGDALWDGAFQADLDRLETVQIRAMRIVTGATARSSVQGLYNDLGWHTLQQRRSMHKLKWFFKLQNHLAPEYLVNLVPPTADERHRYLLRRRDTVTPFRVQRDYFARSFFPSVVREWNALPQHIRHATTVEGFTVCIKKHFKSPPKTPWYGCGDRHSDIHHARMRLGCSKLKSDLHFNLHVEDNPQCACGYAIEDSVHYFFHCPNFDQQRRVLLNSVGVVAQPTNALLLYGSDTLSLDQNITVAMYVKLYIHDTARFR